MVTDLGCGITGHQPVTKIQVCILPAHLVSATRRRTSSTAVAVRANFIRPFGFPCVVLAVTQDLSATISLAS